MNCYRHFLGIALACFVFFFLSIQESLCYEYHVTPQNEQLTNRLNDAFRHSREADLICVIDKPEFPEFSSIAQAVFYRCNSQNSKETLIRLDILSNGEICYSFIKNDDGQFAINHKFGFAVAGGDFFRLFYLDSLFAGFDPQVMKYSEYKIQENASGNRSSYFITCSIPKEIWNDMSYIRGLTRSRDREMEILDNYPYTRVYKIDGATNIVQSCTTFNSKGKKLSFHDIGKANFTPDWSKHKGIFDTPNNIKTRVVSTKSFLILNFESNIRWNLTQLKERNSKPKTNLNTAILDFLLSKYTAYALAVIGVAMLISIVVYRKSKRGY